MIGVIAADADVTDPVFAVLPVVLHRLPGIADVLVIILCLALERKSSQQQTANKQFQRHGQFFRMFLRFAGHRSSGPPVADKGPWAFGPGAGWFSGFPLGAAPFFPRCCPRQSSRWVCRWWCWALLLPV